MRRGIAAFSLLLCLLIESPLCAADWVLYDDFASGSIDPVKWYGTEIGDTGREAGRVVVNETLNMFEQSYGYNDANVGVPDASMNLYATQGANIKAMKATIKAVKFETLGCDADSDSTLVEARMWGRFFNTETVPASGTNDVYAFISIYRDSSKAADGDNVLRIKATVRQCQDDACDNKVVIATKEFGTIKKGQKATLSMEWDKAKHRFLFGCNAKSASLSYDPKLYPETSTPYYRTKKLQVRGQVPNCTSTPRPKGMMNAMFDDIYIKTN